MAINTDIVVLGVDWGTTHRRTYALNAAGQCIAEHADDEGALACKGRFEASLTTLLGTLHAQPAMIIMAGMVGSALGWQVVPYVESGVALNDLASHLCVLPQPGATTTTLAIVPGYCVRTAAGQPDVMRGEETQLLGAWCLGHRSGWFVLPGTHSKWVQLHEGRVVQLRTYMTGELFELLTRYGTLAAAAGDQATWSDSAFAQGVQASADGALSHQLFSCRARVVSGDMPSASSHAYMSGLLIGAELRDVTQDQHGLQTATEFKLIGSPSLAHHYQAAAALLRLKFEVLDARAAFIAATHHIYQTTTIQ